MNIGWFQVLQRCGLISLGSLIGAGHAAAQTTPSYSESITSFPGGATSSNAAGMISGSRCFTSGTPCSNGYSYTADAEPTGGGLAHVTLSASGLAGIFSAQVQAGVSYGISVLGAPNVFVPITIGSYVSATATNTGVPARGTEITSSASLVVRGQGVMYNKQCVAYQFASVPGGCTEAVNTFVGSPVANSSTSSAIYLLSGSLYTVTLMASASSAEFGSADAFVDPVFTIDPAFATSFSLVGVPDGSSGGATSAVPEPATWAMMILGMAAVGFAIRRQQQITTRASYFN